MQRNELCHEVMGSARGDDTDSLLTTDHLAACSECRTDLAEFRSVAHWARVTFEVPPAPYGLAQAILVRARDAGALWLTPTRFAVSLASVVAITLLTASITTPTGDDLPVTRAQLDRPQLAIRVQPAGPSRVTVLTVGPAGVDQRELDLDARFVVDEVPANALVIDTF